MAPHHKDTLKRLALVATVLGGLLTVLGTAKATADGRYVRATQYDKDRLSDSLHFWSRDSVLTRIDARVSAMYCAGLPVDKQPGCK